MRLLLDPYRSFSIIIIGQLSMQCHIKSKYRGIWEPSLLAIDGQSIAFVIERDQKKKSIPFNGILDCSIATTEAEAVLTLKLQKREYEIKAVGSKLGKAVDAYKLWQFFQHYQEVKQQKMQRPKMVNYQSKASVILNRQKQLKSQEESAEIQKRIEQQRLKEMQRRKQEEENREVVEYQTYYKVKDWQRDEKLGGLLFINEEKKSMQPKIIKYLISRFITTGSFMGISFPVFAMKPQGILETYCRCLSLAPRLLTGLKDPIDRIKAFNALILTLSIRFVDVDKSYNPTIGQTFQTFLQGCEMYAEQVSHHPPISAFLLYGQGFKLYGSLEVQASMGFNTARGRFYGDIIVDYQDGGKLVGRLPCGILSGYLFGRYVFYPQGASYIFDPVNQLLCSYQVTTEDYMEGYIGRLNYKSWLEFCQLMNANDQQERREKKYEDFQHVPETNCEKVYSRVRVKWTQFVEYDGQVVLDYEDAKILPPKLSKKVPKPLLLSDSRHRKDIQLREAQLFDESQDEKQRLEEQQRRLRKLRQSYQKK